MISRREQWQVFVIIALFVILIVTSIVSGSRAARIIHLEKELEMRKQAETRQ